MQNLYDETKYLMKKYNIFANKNLRQNFLIDTHVLDKIVKYSNITKDDMVLEIGPGIGTMTQYLCENARKVVAVEIDEYLIPILGDTLKAYDNVEVINNDILKLDLNKLVQEKNDGKRIKVVANLPYYITTPIIMELLEKHVPVDCITVMVQKEVAERMQAGPRSKDYGALSLAVQYYSKPEVVANVPPNCFMPRPNVASSVIKLDLYEEPEVKVNNEEHLFKLIRASFNQRRKTLANGIKNFQGLNYSREEVVSALNNLGIREDVRGEALSLQEFAALSDELEKRRTNGNI